MNTPKKKIMILAVTASLMFCSTAVWSGNAGAEGATPSPERKDSSKQHIHPHGKDGKARAGGHFIIKESSKLLDMETSTLIDNLKAGKTLPQLALEKKGWTEEQFIQKLAESAGQNMDKAVAEGRLTASEAKRIKEQLPTILKLKINNMGKFHE